MGPTGPIGLPGPKGDPGRRGRRVSYTLQSLDFDMRTQSLPYRKLEIASSSIAIFVSLSRLVELAQSIF